MRIFQIKLSGCLHRGRESGHSEVRGSGQGEGPGVLPGHDAELPHHQEEETPGEHPHQLLPHQAPPARQDDY